MATALLTITSVTSFTPQRKTVKIPRYLGKRFADAPGDVATPLTLGEPKPKDPNVVIATTGKDLDDELAIVKLWLEGFALKMVVGKGYEKVVKIVGAVLEGDVTSNEIEVIRRGIENEVQLPFLSIKPREMNYEVAKRLSVSDLADLVQSALEGKILIK